MVKGVNNILVIYLKKTTTFVRGTQVNDANK